MSDPRLTPDPAITDMSEVAQLTQPVVDLCRAPSGPRDRQLLFGDPVTVLRKTAGWSYIQSAKDNYCGFILTDSHGPRSQSTHFVSAPATHAYKDPDFKSPDQISLGFGSHITATSTDQNFIQTDVGFIPTQHLTAVPQAMYDPAEVAAMLLGTPYLWGGNSRWGIDCSGLVQAALLACAIPCPGDSDMQEKLGTDATGRFQRNDLVFWKGHVALVVNATTLIHANASAMACVYEPIDAAIARIGLAGDGPVTAHRRLQRFTKT